MSKAEIEWKAAAIFKVTRAVITSDPEFKGELPLSYRSLTEKGKEVLRRAATRRIAVIDAAWESFWGKRKRKQYQSYRSPYRDLGLHASTATRGHRANG